MPIRLIALDMDGTMLPASLTISQADAAAIAEAAQAGITVVLASGRRLGSMLPFYRQLGLATPTLSCNGAVISHADGQPLETHRVSQADAREVIAWAQEKRIFIELFIGETFLYDEVCDEQVAYERMSGIRGIRVPDLADAVADEGADKLLMIGDPAYITAIRGELENATRGRLNVFTSSAHYLEVTHRLATKGQALARLCAHLGIDARDVMAVGDAENDMDMIAFAGAGVAMGNGVPALREAADFVTLSIEESGVAHAIRTLALPG